MKNYESWVVFLKKRQFTKLENLFNELSFFSSKVMFYYALDVFASAIYWDPNFFAKKFVLGA